MKQNNIDYACAECLEQAGGRQMEHGIEWKLEICPVCAIKTTVTSPAHFGNPQLQAKVLPFPSTKGQQ